MTSKKGQSKLWWILGTAVIVFLVVLLMSGPAKQGIQKTFGIINVQLDENGDCDRDRVANYFDKCPCISTLGVQGEFSGCPKGTLPEQAERDRKTCALYVTDTKDKFVEQCGKENEEKCVLDKDENYLTHCAQVRSVSPDVPESAGKGVSTQGDLVLTSFKADGKTNNDKIVKDLRNNEDAAWIPFVVEIENQGKEAIKNSFNIGVFVCDTKQQNCVLKKIYSKEGGKDVGTGIPITQKMEVGIQKKDISQFFVYVGSEGDACDASDDTPRECWLKVKVDSTDVLDEGVLRESNNEQGIVVYLEHQKVDIHDFPSYKTIHIKAQDDAPRSYDAFQICKGYIGEKELERGSYYCSAKDTCEDDFLQPSSLWSYPTGCWVVISEEDGDGNDCGEVLAQPGFYLNKGEEGKQIDWIKEAGYHSDGNEPDPQILITKEGFKWKSPLEGSILCSDNVENRWIGGQDNWELCDEQGEGKIARLKEGKEFVCKNEKWSCKNC